MPRTLFFLLLCVTVSLAQYGINNGYVTAPYYNSGYGMNPRMYYQQQYAIQQNYNNNYYNNYYGSFNSYPGYGYYSYAFNGYNNPGSYPKQLLFGTERAGLFLRCQGRACQG